MTTFMTASPTRTLIMATSFLASFAASPALAASAQGKAQSKSDARMIVVTASATEVDLRDAPASISVITREEIERQPVQSVGELLGRLPGVTGSISPTGAMAKISIRGLPDNYTLLLVDGRRIGNARDISYRPDLGRQDLNWISPDMIERIEVVRGPMSSIYGSDAMGGVVNIITRKVAPTWRGSVSSSYTRPEKSDRGDSYQIGLNATGPITQSLGLRVGATYARTNPDEMIISNNNGTAGVKNTNLNGVLTWQPVDDHSVSAEASYGLEEPIAPATRAANGNAQSSWGSDVKRLSLRLGHEAKWNFGTSRIDIYRNAFVNRDQEASGGKAELKETLVDALFNIETNFLVDHKIALGGQYRDEELTNTQTIGTIPVDYGGNIVDGATLSGHTAALFIEDQLALTQSLLLTLGGRLDSHHRYGEHFSPRGYIVWHPVADFTLRGGISQGFRAPSLKENSAGAATQSRGNGCNSLTGLGYTGGGCYMAGNPNLKPETSTNYEIGLAYDTELLNFSTTYFHTDFKNKIEYAPLGFYEGRWWTMMENIQRARTRGLEMTGGARVLFNLKLRANATWMIKAKNRDTGANLITAPKWTGYASLDWQATQRLGLYLSGQYTGKQLGGGNTITDSLVTFDLTSAFDVTKKSTLRAGIQNLAAKKVTGDSGFGYYSPGRRFFVGFNSRF